MRREDKKPLTDSQDAMSWLYSFLARRPQKNSPRVVRSTKLVDLIYRGFVHDDTDFQQLLENATTPYLAELANDLFTAFYSLDVCLYDESLNPSPNDPIIRALIRHPEFPSLKVLCEDKELPSYSACTEFCHQLVCDSAFDVSFDLAFYRELADSLDRQMDQLLSKLKKSKSKRNSMSLVNRLAQKASQLENIQMKIAEYTTQYRSSLQEHIGVAIDRARECAANTSAILMAWGSDDGTMRDSQPNRELLEHVKNSKLLLEMAHTLGKYRDILANKRKNAFNYGLGEKYDLMRGNELSQCLSSELALLGTPESEILFFQKMQLGRLQQYRKRAATIKGDGDFIVLVDESGSTELLQSWAKSLALALLDVAARGKRRCALIHFSSADEIQVDLFEPGHYTAQDVMAAAEHFFNGGTDFERPLKEALDLLDQGYDNADITIITDGECSISESFQKHCIEQLARKRATLTAVLLDAGRDCGTSLEPLCNKVYHARDMLKDEIAVDILNGVA